MAQQDSNNNDNKKWSYARVDTDDGEYHLEFKTDNINRIRTPSGEIAKRIAAGHILNHLKSKGDITTTTFENTDFTEKHGSGP